MRVSSRNDQSVSVIALSGDSPHLPPAASHCRHVKRFFLGFAILVEDNLLDDWQRRLLDRLRRDDAQDLGSLFRRVMSPFGFGAGPRPAITTPPIRRIPINYPLQWETWRT